MARSAIAAGFTNNGLVTIVAISGAESGWSSDATHNSSRPGSPDYVPLTPQQIALGWVPEYSVGPVQIDLELHSEISEADARSFDGAAKWAWINSAQGAIFTIWSTYTGAGGQQATYLDYINAAEAAIQSLVDEDSMADRRVVEGTQDIRILNQVATEALGPLAAGDQSSGVTAYVRYGPSVDLPIGEEELIIRVPYGTFPNGLGA